MTDDLLIRGATILDPVSPLRRADIRVNGGLVTEIDAGLRPDSEAVIDAWDRVAMPGLVNAHTHSGQSLDRGTALNLPLDLWMVWSIYAGIEHSPEDSYTTAASGALEMLTTGCTTVIDQVFLPAEDFFSHSAAVRAAYEDVGMRAYVAPMLQDRDFLKSLELESLASWSKPALSPDYEPQRLIGHLRDFVDGFEGADRRLRPMLGPTAPQRCSDEFMVLVTDLARERDLRVHTHLLETKTQRLACARRWARPLLEHLSQAGLLSSRTSFAHGVWLAPDEHRALKAAGAVVVHNPISNMRLGSGVLPLQYLLASGVPVAIGTDGAASNDTQDICEALKSASMLNTLYGGFRTWAQPEDVWRACLLGGAQAVGARIGRIEVGAAADVVLVRADRHVLAPRGHLVASLVNGGIKGSIDTVVVAGRLVVEDGTPVFPGARDLEARSRAYMERSASSYESRRRVYDNYQGLIAPAIDEAAIDAMEPVRWWQG
ncbi:MAG: amidohydrolase family protein [Acidimicrobiales bacterium]